ncbi:MAG: GNAT family N-acetyltransferase [Bacteroidota bacterium]
MKPEDIIVTVATQAHTHYAQEICDEMAASAKVRGTGIAQREPEDIIEKMLDGKAVVAFHTDGRWAGFSYVEVWSNGDYVSNSGLIVNPEFRQLGIAKRVKQEVFNLSRTKFPDAKVISLTTGLAVMKLNSDLGFVPVTYSEMSQDDDFWKGCKSCVNYEILQMKERKNCLCTALVFDPKLATNATVKDSVDEYHKNSNLYDRYMNIKANLLLKNRKKGGSRLGAFLSLFI